MRTKDNVVKRAWRRVLGDYKRGGLRGAYHWVRCHVWNRYHVINVSGEDGYDWGWMDRDHVLMLACFKILKEFVEKEDQRIGLRTVDDYGGEHMTEDERESFEKGQLAHEREIRALYTWWTVDRKREHAEVDAIIADADVDMKFGEPDGSGCSPLDFVYAPGSQEKWELYRKRTDELDAKDDKMLLRLMAVRRSLWT